MSGKKNFEKRIYESRFFRDAKLKAEEISNDPKLLNDLISQADKKAQKKGRGVLGESLDSLMTFSRMLKAYAGGKYRKIPWKTLVAIVGSVVYFVMPLDFIPDFILGLGFADDVTLLLWTMKWAKKDVDEFSQWEQKEQTKIQN